MSPGQDPEGGVCWSCGAGLTALDFGRGDTCPRCGRDTKVCRGCEHYDTGHHNECREPQAERVVDKERSNFCDYFRPKVSGPANATPSRDALKAAAEALFRKK